MPGYLRQSTASQSRALGPFISDSDFKTVQTGLTIANTDIKLVVNGGSSANKNSGGGTHRVNGVYGVTWDATDTATVGEMEVSVLVSGALVVFDKFFVIEEVAYDMLFAASALGYVDGATVNTTKVNGTSQTAGDIIGDTNDIQSRLPAALVSGRIDASIGAVAAGVIAAASFASGALDAVWSTATRVLTAATNITAAIADAVWDEALSGHTTPGSAGATLSSAGSAGDPWATDIPGAYTGVQAGKVVGDALDVAVGTRSAPGDAMALTSGERNSTADALLDRTNAVETGLTPRGALRLALAALAGKLSGGSTTAVFRNAVQDSKDRITATVDPATGNRTAVSTDVT